MYIFIVIYSVLQLVVSVLPSGVFIHVILEKITISTNI